VRDKIARRYVECKRTADDEGEKWAHWKAAAFKEVLDYLDTLSRARCVEGAVRDDNPNSIDIIAIEAPLKPGTRVTVVIEEGRDA